MNIIGKRWLWLCSLRNPKTKLNPKKSPPAKDLIERHRTSMDPSVHPSIHPSIQHTCNRFQARSIITSSRFGVILENGCRTLCVRPFQCRFFASIPLLLLIKKDMIHGCLFFRMLTKYCGQGLARMVRFPSPTHK